MLCVVVDVDVKAAGEGLAGSGVSKGLGKQGRDVNLPFSSVLYQRSAPGERERGGGGRRGKARGRNVVWRAEGWRSGQSDKAYTRPSDTIIGHI